MWFSRLSDDGTRRAAPIPWIARAVTRTAKLGAKPQAIDASVNSTNPPTNIRLAPIRSPSAPAVRMKAANVTVYALTTSWSELTPSPSDAPIDLTATLTTLTSSWTTQKPRLVAISVRRRARMGAEVDCIHRR